MNRHVRPFILVLAALFLLAGCLVSGDVDGPPLTPDGHQFTAADTAEAELIALYLSGELYPPLVLTERITRDLAAIRSTYRQQLSYVSDRGDSLTCCGFRAPWVLSRIQVEFDGPTAIAASAGQYHAWDDLNAEFGTRIVEIRRERFFSLETERRVHPDRLAERYASLPGAVGALRTGYAGDGPNVYGRETLDGMTYLFRRGWMDCPEWCINNEFWYFRFEKHRPVLVGHFAVVDGVTAYPPILPDWWFDARENVIQYYGQPLWGWM